MPGWQPTAHSLKAKALQMKNETALLDFGVDDEALSGFRLQRLEVFN